MKKNNDPMQLYRTRVKKEWQQLIRTPSKENVYQQFLEKNPSLLPGCWGDLGLGYTSKRRIPPFPYAVISQPTLNGSFKRIPDFLWIYANQTYISPVFIEIETPQKKWFTQEGIQSAEFSHAYNHFWTGNRG